MFQVYSGSGFGREATPEEASALEAAQLNWSNLPQTKVGQPIIMIRSEGGKLRRLVSCGNCNDPRLPNFERYFCATLEAANDEKLFQREIANCRKWLDLMVQADPLPNENYTTEQLKRMGLIGLYLWEDIPELELRIYTGGICKGVSSRWIQWPSGF